MNNSLCPEQFLAVSILHLILSSIFAFQVCFLGQHFPQSLKFSWNNLVRYTFILVSSAPQSEVSDYKQPSPKKSDKENGNKNVKGASKSTEMTDKPRWYIFWIINFNVVSYNNELHLKLKSIATVSSIAQFLYHLLFFCICKSDIIMCLFLIISIFKQRNNRGSSTQRKI